MLLFTAFQTASMSARFVTEAIKRELSNSTNMTDTEINSRIGDGYISMSLLYAVFAMANFFSPSIVKICGHKASMVSYHQKVINHTFWSDKRFLVKIIIVFTKVLCTSKRYKLYHITFLVLPT